MGCCVSGAHIEFEEDFEEFGNIEQEMGVQNDSIQGRGEKENNEEELCELVLLFSDIQFRFFKL